MGPSWRAQLGRFNYLRSLRMQFVSKGNYVDLAKRYRRFVQDSGLFVSLKDKIASKPVVANVVGNAFIGLSVLVIALSQVLDWANAGATSRVAENPAVEDDYAKDSYDPPDAHGEDYKVETERVEAKGLLTASRQGAPPG